ncbi:MAG: Asp-tRNA(Asn)/Glu-tRNA(Gln) amidotransferase subunit GatB, partial [Candidatus Omnitrophica bacterium]|nr:Asp-tRNA(Asn)/Glu-tRNA(Gln) amidotransferase subunit GatB [Candidatus Omnitrophota bacterium]
MRKYDTVIGLEVHVQLATKTKIFCSCSTTFGAEANTQVCPVCLGLPGVLPVLNRKAFEYAIKVAVALGCDIQKQVKFDRKNYYYPDLPKNYQISQYDMPIAYNGKIDVKLEDGTKKMIGITRAHLEEDAGKLIHDPNKPFSYVDLNRTGTPLLEIVSEPVINSPDEAHKYLVTLKQVIEYLGVSDCNMEEGSLRCDANISLKEKGAIKLGRKVEIKNLNSFKAVREALLHEQTRQAEMLDEGKKISQETRLWDEAKGETLSMRTKEEAHDYRYFPEPDLVPFEVDAEIINKIKKEMPEMPQIKREKFLNYGLDEKIVENLIGESSTANYCEQVFMLGAIPEERQAAANWINGEMMSFLNESGKADIAELNIKPKDLVDLVK